MSLKQYHSKRHFSRTSEPRGRTSKRTGWRFVVQKHDASHLHYDFRMELRGVLLSWAIPKGPSLDPDEKRLAVHVEDHPLDYVDFEGAIPEGEYGGGTVMVWDRGTWEPVGDPERAYKRGRLVFTLQGEKLHGAWNLVRMGRASGNGKENWLLIKSRDEHARALRRGDILEKKPRSVKTARDLDEIATGKSSRTRKVTPRHNTTGTDATSHKKKKLERSIAKPHSAHRFTQRSKSSPLPLHPKPQLATLASTPPGGDEWLHEIKFDGYRMFAIIDGGKVKFRSRNDHDWTKQLSSLSDAVAALPVRRAVLDGEVVVLNDEGVSRFQLLQNALGDDSSDAELIYFVFDILHLDGRDLRDLPLEVRKQILERLLPAAKKPRPVRYSAHVVGHGEKLHRTACRTQLEGLISKRRTAAYHPGRGRDWIKSKCGHEQEFVIGGFTNPAGSRSGFGALLLGYYDPKHGFTYAGRVGTGFTDRSLRDLTTQFRRLERARSPFDQGTKVAAGRDVHWIKPTKVAQIKFAEWTHDGLLRHPSFLGLRLDKAAKNVVRERPIKRPR